MLAAHNSPTNKVEKFLNHLLKQKIKWKPKYTVKNSVELAKKLKELNLPPNAKLISLDVDSLFTNVDVKETVSTIQNIANKDSNLSSSEIKEICHLIEFCTKHNYFQYKEEFFRLKDGLPMGSPLSLHLADVFLNRYDVIINSGKWKSKIHRYFRYVDDILAIWIGTDRELKLFLKEINQLNPRLKFKLEVGNKEINFLDLNIKIFNNRLIFEIYRKPGSTDAIIPANSYHNHQHKMAAFRSLIHRLVTLPLTKAGYRKELNTILKIAENNGYEKQAILRMLRKKKETLENRTLFNGTMEDT